jgi:hypothetical protein
VSIQSLIAKLKAGVVWFGKEIGKGIARLPKILRIAEDAEKTAQDALPLVLVVVEDAGALAAATAKDSGVFITAFAELSGAITLAVATKAMNISADTAVVAAFENFCSKFNSDNVHDVLTAWEQLSADTHKLDTALLTDVEKLEADAKS